QEDDRRRKELIEARNQADSMIYSVEKNIKDFGDKISSDDKARIETAVAKVKKALEGDDLGAIRSAQDELTQASHKLAEAMYAKSTEQQAGQQEGAQAGAGPQPGQGKKDDDVVDADFEEVK
ncbi:MAG: Hsp70 family protein, partial [Syntrophales bacterium]|nr:Hsp70 family protein [Syntrophales bacterium]